MTILGRMGPEAADAVDPLFQIALGDNSTLTSITVENLGKIGSAARSAIPELSQLTNQRDPNVRCALVWAMARIAPEAEDTSRFLEAAREDANERVRKAADSATLHARNAQITKPHHGVYFMPGLVIEFKKRSFQSSPAHDYAMVEIRGRCALHDNTFGLTYDDGEKAVALSNTCAVVLEAIPNESDRPARRSLTRRLVTPDEVLHDGNFSAAGTAKGGNPNPPNVPE
jgi:hypothetical protein